VAAVHSPFRQVDLGSNGVRFARPDVALDLGGIAKGYAVDRAVDALRAHGVTGGMINVGGDLYAIGRSPDGDAWNVGIRNPANPDTMIDSFPLTDGAVATSGDYLRFFEYGGHRYHHLMDPTTGAPRECTVRSLTVKAETCMAADAAATAAFGLGTDEAQRLVAGVRARATVVKVI
jgi:thiamine biosynthesis lipoprotein